MLEQKSNLNHLVKPSFQGVNRRFVLAFENDAQRTSNKRYPPTLLIKDYNVMIDRKNVFDQPVKNNIRTYDQGHDYTIGCLLDYVYFKNYYKMIAIDLSKQQAQDANLKAIQQINFNWNLHCTGNTTIFFIIEEANETILGISQVHVRVIWIYFALI